MNLEVGNYYLNASGEIILIIKKTESEDIDDYNYKGNNNEWYYYDGRYDIEKSTKQDLIAEIPPELHWNLMYNIKNFHTNGNVRKKIRRKYNNYMNCCISKNKELK